MLRTSSRYKRNLSFLKKISPKCFANSFKYNLAVARFNLAVTKSELLQEYGDLLGTDNISGVILIFESMENLYPLKF